MEKNYGMIQSEVDERDFIYGNLEFAGRASTLPRKYRLQETPIRDQGWLGSCLGMASSAVCEADSMARYNKNVGHLSPLFAYANAKSLDGKPTVDGTTSRAMLDGLKKYGICEERFYPYIDDADTRKNKFPAQLKEAKDNALKYKPKAYARLTDIEDIKEAVYHENGCIICVGVFDNFEDTYRGFLKPPKGTHRLNHAMAVVGYDDDLEMVVEGKKYKGYLVLKNSYGTREGDGGYCYMPYEAMSWKVVYDVDKFFREAWTVVDVDALENKDYHKQKFNGVAITPKQKILKLTVGNKTAYVDGVAKTLSSPPVIKNGCTFVPIRFVSESLGARVYYDNEEKRIGIYDDNTKISIDMWIGNHIAKVKGNDYKMLEAPYIDNGSTQVPVRAVSEMLGYRVDYSPTTKEITIKA